MKWRRGRPAREVEIELSTAQAAVADHVRGFFAGHQTDLVRWHEPHALDRVPNLSILSVQPGSVSGFAVSVTLGCWDAQHTEQEHGVEFLLIGNDPPAEQRALRLAMTAYYHANPDATFRLDIGHTVPLGEPWHTGSELDALLVCLPYTFGPDLERCQWSGGHARLLWALPISTAELRFRHGHGLDALEARFEEASIEYWNPRRPSVI